MDKSFQIKIFGSDSVSAPSGYDSAQVLTHKKISFSPTWNEEINGGQGEFVLDYYNEEKYGTLPGYFAENNVVKVYEISDDYPLGQLAYSGYISKVLPYLRSNESGFTITVLGYVSKLMKQYYRNGATWEVQETSTTPEQIFKNIIDQVNAVYPFINYTGSSVDSSGITVVDKTYSQRYWLEAINDTLELAKGFYWFIDQNGVAYFKQKPSSATHTFRLQKDVEDFLPELDYENITNDVQCEWASGTQAGSDSTSITNHERNQKYISDTSLADSGDADDRIDRELEENKDQKRQTEMTINSQFNIVLPHPGDTCEIINLIKGSTLLSNNMQIVRKTYGLKKAKFQLERIRTFGNQLNLFVNKNQ